MCRKNANLIKIAINLLRTYIECALILRSSTVILTLSSFISISFYVSLSRIFNNKCAKNKLNDMD